MLNRSRRHIDETDRKQVKLVALCLKGTRALEECLHASEEFKLCFH